jgi:hypothetical protein
MTLLKERPYSVSEEQAGFPDSTVPYEKQFEEIVTI